MFMNVLQENVTSETDVALPVVLLIIFPWESKNRHVPTETAALTTLSKEPSGASTHVRYIYIHHKTPCS